MHSVQAISDIFTCFDGHDAADIVNVILSSLQACNVR